ncbi:MAG: DUF1801 domain-containing protein [Corynebacterium sp.]|nr:DUF1801 domain-containing protein [Corynebacterium sp.]
MSIHPLHDEWLLEHFDGPTDPRYDFSVDLLSWICDNFPQLECVIKWNQPMFLDEGHFILGFNIAAKHVSLAPEGQMIERYHDRLVAAGYNPGKKFMRIPLTKEPDWDLIHEIIETNIREKAGKDSFWR